MATIKKNKEKKAKTAMPASVEKQEAKKASSSTDTTKKKKKKAEEDLDKANLDTAAGKEPKTIERDLKYIYPEDVTSSKQKKEFRRKMRQQSKQLEAKIKRLKKSTEPGAEKELKAAQKEMDTFRKENYNQSALAESN